MSSNCSKQKDGLKCSGGHVLYASCSHLTPVDASAAATVLIAELIRWVLEHKGINITKGDIDLGHKTVNNWKKVLGNKIPLPNTYLGYVRWCP